MAFTGTTRRGMTALALGALLLGFAAIYTKFAAQGGAQPLGIGFYRMLSALPFVALMAWTGGESRGTARQQVWAAAAGLLSTVVLDVFEYGFSIMSDKSQVFSTGASGSYTVTFPDAGNYLIRFWAVDSTPATPYSSSVSSARIAFNASFQ